VAIERAAALAGKAAPVLGTIKQRMYAPVLVALRDAEIAAPTTALPA
jgi:hypothetical protein